MTPIKGRGRKRASLLRAATAWYHRYFSDPQARVLALLLLAVLGVVLFLGEILTPVLAAVVVAYLLEGLVGRLAPRRLTRFRAVLLVYTLFIAFVLLLVFALTPLVWAQTLQLAKEVPGYLSSAQHVLLEVPKRYPFVSTEEVEGLLHTVRAEFGAWGQRLFARSIAAIPGIITLMVYLILVPLLVFFFLKDKEKIIDWFRRILPEERALAGRVWHEVDRQIGNYVRGKFWEIVVVGVVTTITFVAMGLKYAVLLGFLVGLSVLVPYIGAVVVTFPVALVAFSQWGWGSEFLWLMGAYGIIQAIDGNVLVPLLFSGVVNLHPIAIIVAVLFFGGIWGFWGVFFAIPLATLVNAILIAWPRPLDEEEGGEAEGARTIDL